MKTISRHAVSLLLLVFVLSLTACKQEDIAKSIGKGIDVLDVVKKSLTDAEAKQLAAPGSNQKFFDFIDRTTTNLKQAKTIAENVNALEPDQRKNILAILATVRAGLNDLDLTGIKDPGLKKKVQAGFLGFGTGIDALKIALQE